MNFFGREEQLTSLDIFFEQKNAGFVFLRGKRRVGKSWLLKHFQEKYPDDIFYFMGADDSSDKQHRIDFALAWDEFRNTELSDLRTEKLTWKKIFKTIEQKVKESGKNFVICLDEIQWLCKSQSGFAGRLKEAWIDWQKIGIKIIVCGSSRRFFSKIVEGDEKILRGLKTQSDMWLPEFSLEEVQKYYFPKWSHEQVVLTYMMFGGLPYYLERITGDNFLRAINDATFTNSTIFLEEIDNILRLEFNRLGVNSVKKILETLGQDGITGPMIIARSGVANSTIYENIEKLKDYNILFEKKKINGEDDETRYFLKDQFLNFYFQTLAPLESRILKNKNRALLFPCECIQSKTGYYIPNFTGKAFELLIRNILESKDFFHRGIFKKLDIRDENYSVGTYWSNHTQIDLIVEHNSDREARIIECKWINEDNLKPGDYIQQVLNKKYIPNKNIEKVSYFIVVSQEVSPLIEKKAQDKGIKFITLKDLF